MSVARVVLVLMGFFGLAVAAGYSVVAFLAQLAWRMRNPVPAMKARPPVTLLKPLCGAEPGLYEHLRGFCVQDYPDYQIIFGVRDPADPARAVAERLVAEFPALPIEIVVNPRQHGSNRKVSNLINMLARARHEWLVLADSDTFVGADYLAAVTPPLADETVGLVTCIYRGVPTPHIWSRLGAMYINEWYVPSVILAWLFGYDGYVSGQTMCLRRNTLQRVGGFEAIADHLADDHRLGELVGEQGLRVVLSAYVVRGEHHERTLESLARHEMRWMRTIRVLRPLSFRLIFLSFSLPLAILGLALVVGSGSPAGGAWSLFLVTAAIRLVLHLVYRFDGGRPAFADVWLLPARDILLVCIWAGSFFTSRVT
ncbi:MAG: bacteriohopanetetrol glucosamine biosynthesis glycosyltransferase HpnI, partial [Pseudomonadota bacterium]|nr:bacteriohopanetetrol glucosamine biosynthesis glycosyltransferase HpnI [Pseudomonadota bacterium]